MTRTLVVSDLHLGASSDADVLRREGPRQALLDALGDVDRLVLLGDALELRHGPRRDALAVARPFFESLGRALAGREIVVVPGNHDHALAELWLRAREHSGSHLPLQLEQRIPAAEGSSMLAALAGWAAPARVEAAYPGLWLRSDVYATHGHQLDCHLTIPTMERLAIALTARAVRRPADTFVSADDYEAVSAPVFAWIDAVARQAAAGDVLNGQTTVRMWRALGGDRPREEAAAANGRGQGFSARGQAFSAGIAGLAALGPALRRRAIAGAFPFAVAALNRMGLGSFNSNLSVSELRRAALRSMGEVAERLGLGDAYVLFGHTHRAGPLPRDDAAEWIGSGGARLMNAGCWVYAPYFVTAKPGESPYWPGGAILVEDDGPPQMLRLLDDYDAERLSSARA